ncbi:MAG: beta-N-acetylhexosaminidase [Oligoflexia bacterium]|nr:beta-N-acetylhexosaminidase [Oligoflexia bacterium]
MAKRSELEYKLSQMFIVGLPGTELSEPSREFLKDYQPGGVIYFAHNYDTPALVAEMSDAIQSTRDKARNLPLFISVDHEGGKVQRFRKQFIHFPEPIEIGEIGSPKLAFLVAEVMAKELKAVGVNLDYHPLCDVHTRPSNPVIGRRAFGSDEELVSKLASAMVRGFVANGVISCIKHFPGHGDTTVDSHFDLPMVDVPWNELKEREVKPFVRAIRSRVDMIMTAHILNKAIDPIYPATLSYSTITNHLRKELRFNKLIITDDMQMDAVAKNFGEKDMIALAINAGCDILLYRHEEKGRAAMDAAFEFLREGRITADQVEASYARIKEVKERMLLPYNDVRMNNLDLIGCESHKEVLNLVLNRQKPPGAELSEA